MVLKPKRSKGQPPKGEDRLKSVSVQLHPTELAKVQSIADKELCSVSLVIRKMVRYSLGKTHIGH